MTWSTGSIDPTVIVENTPVNGTATEPVPSIRPKVNSASNPPKVTSSFGTTVVPWVDVISKFVGIINVPTETIESPNVEVIDWPVTDTS